MRALVRGTVVDRIDLRQSIAYVVNGIIMLLAFFLARIVLMAVFAYQFVTYFHEFSSPPWQFHCLMWTAIGSVYVMNSYWFMRMLYGAIKVLGQRGSADVKVKQQ